MFGFTQGQVFSLIIAFLIAMVLITLIMGITVYKIVSQYEDFPGKRTYKHHKVDS